VEKFQRGLSRKDAAAYAGCDSISAFKNWIRRGILPGPIPGTHRWDRKAIDRALDKASGLEQTSTYEKGLIDESSATPPPSHPGANLSSRRLPPAVNQGHQDVLMSTGCWRIKPSEFERTLKSIRSVGLHIRSARSPVAPFHIAPKAMAGSLR
jgi:hypothetical protein